MKITNPTVFQKDGELFCLTCDERDVPKPGEFAYEDDLAHHKSSAVKVKNQDEAYKFLLEQYGSPVMENLLATLNGYEAEVLEYCCYDSCPVSGCCEFCPEGKSLATITPIHKEEESQEEQYAIFKEFYLMCIDLDGMDLDLAVKHFTLTRKV